MRKKSAGKADVVFLASLPCVPAQNAIHARQAARHARTHALRGLHAKTTKLVLYIHQCH